jgi:hypothetical protein
MLKIDNHTGKKDMYRVKMPIQSDLKKWLSKWLGYTSIHDVELVAGVGKTEIGALILLACTKTPPTAEDPDYKTIDGYDEQIPVWLPKNHFLSNEKIVQLNQTLNSYLVAQNSHCGYCETASRRFRQNVSSKCCF